jgi:hypothetical protein
MIAFLKQAAKCCFDLVAQGMDFAILVRDHFSTIPGNSVQFTRRIALYANAKMILLAGRKVATILQEFPKSQRQFQFPIPNYSKVEQDFVFFSKVHQPPKQGFFFSNFLKNWNFNSLADDADGDWQQ